MKLFNGIGSMKKLIIMAIMTVVGFLMPNAKAQTSTLGSDSVYTITQGTASDYTYKTGYGDNVQYYKVNLNTNNMSTSSSIVWTELLNSTGSNLMLSLPHNGDTSNPEVKYFAYTYTMPTGYTKTNQRVENPTADQVNNKLFKGASIIALNFSIVYGGAIYNSSTIDTIVGDFIGNYAQSKKSKAYSGAIYNAGSSKIGDITGDFIGNYAQGSSYAYGGAIYNGGTIGSITGDFIDNYAQGNYAYGGAIRNSGTIGSITGDFIGNYTQCSSGGTGGAIHNSGTIGSITGDFIGNYAQGSSGGSGGAIYNGGTIETLTGDFIDNFAKSNSTSADGGAIYNNGSYGEIGSITGDFIGNYAVSTGSDKNVSAAYGGAIYNKDTIGSITGDFIGNYAQGSYGAYGGAIHNEKATIGDITGDFIGNYASGSSKAYGGAIYNGNYGTIGDITGDFIGNYAQGSSASGGAIYNDSNATITSINGTFKNNYAEANTKVQGGAIWNAANIDTIDADFTGNYTKSTDFDSNTFGGAIYNTLNIKSIAGNFENNYTYGFYAYGGAIYNAGTITSITENFIANSAQGNVTHGGAIYNNNTINSITSNFLNNYVHSETSFGGAIYNYNSGTIGNIASNFNGNYAQGSIIYGGAIYNQGTINSISANFNNNYASSYGYASFGGAIYNTGTIDEISGSFINNGIISNDTIAFGGAIYTTKDLTFVANNKTNEFTGNYVQVGNGEKQYEAIYVDSADATLTFNATNGGKFVMNDYTNGKTGYNVKLTGDGTGTFELNNQLKGADVTTQNITVDLANDKLDNYTFNSLTSSADTKYELDVDFLNKTSDTITTTNASTGVITITGLNVLSDLSQLTSDYKIKVLNTQNSDLQLALSDEIKNQLNANGEMYLGSQLANSTKEAIKQVTNWNDTYAMLSQYNKLYGSMGLATTTTTNDSIGVTVTRTELSDWEKSGTVTDTLAYVNKNDGGFAERAFNFESAENVYTVKEDLGNTAGKLTINGVADGDKKSTIDINGHEGFVVASGSTLNINNIEIKNATSSGVDNRGSLSFNNVNFINNSNHAENGSAYGGAIYNEGSITSITGDFIGNYAQSTNKSAEGGAIYNAASGVINSIKGNFTENYVTSTGTNGDAAGGAIANEGTITSITGDFIRNKAFSNEDVWGVAIVNTGNIGTITGKFLENYGESKRITETKISAGGIIDNTGNITTLSAEFKDNHLKAASIIHGGAIYNTGTIESITSDFINNKSEANDIAVGGAIYNNGTITSITGSFTSNKIEAKNKTFGGAIVNAKNIGSINATFNNNQIISENDLAKGGAIYNESTITSIRGDFIGNYAQSTGSTAYGGAVYNSGTIETLTGDFINNYIQSTGSSVYGGAIANAGTINEIIGDFIGNYTKKASDNIYIATQGGAIRNSGTINSITGNFYQNYLHGDSGYAGAILGSSMGDITGDFVENYVISTSKNARGGAIGISGAFGKKDENSNVIGGIKGNFQGNWVKLIGNGDAMGGAIYVAAAGETGYIEGSFTENHALNESTENAMGGAIYNLGKIGKLINSSFVGNWAEAKTGTALGGAIYTTNNLNLFADGKDVQIRDNYTMSNGVKDDNAIYVNNSGATLTFNIKNNGSILLKDNIDGATGYKFNVTGDNTGMFYLQNDIRNANVSMGGITLNTINNQVFTNHFNSFTLTDTINMAVDVDLANGTMDRISADTFGEHNGSLNVIGMNLISDMASDVYTKNILFAEGSLKEQVTLSVNNLPDSNFQTTLLTPIYKYNVSYDKSGENGMFVFARPTAGGTGSTGNASDAFNPAILAGSTSAAVGAVGTVNQAVHHSFNNVDAYMNIPYMERMAMKRRNHYALAGVPDDVRQLGKYSPLYLPGDEEESVWVKPYTTFESVPLKNGPKVSNISYGTLVGFDSQMQSLRHGWDRVISGYVGYTGASQRYSGVDATQNGGILGGTVTLYKGNFFNATTLNVGSSVSQNETMYGKDDYTMLMSGIANKTGYNLEFKDGKVILQPSMLVGYTFVNTFDYTNAAGVKIDNKPLHTIQVSPGVKVIGNLKHGWQPYASVNMVWNLMGEYDATANGVKLPEMKVKPYVQYGVGLQKRVKDHFMAYGQAMLHNGGRNGISLTAGFRWALGHKDNCDYEIKEIKSDKKAVKVKTNKKAQTKANKTEIKVKPDKKAKQATFKINKKRISNAK